ncbi:AIPR family protein [Palleronia abyssalis]|uniref:Abortive phage infection protein C-terminal domain-containing protein n=1 Tax=Palleronia abyssalis TaxID=1501240 RepID=A0A2R8BUA1_9RHOB|nr:AIPR family protein [Palleronia abyssalis]SPJ23720.1 hypothetical protein PAA8504_01535 [Palleronia abyssalis]
MNPVVAAQLKQFKDANPVAEMSDASYFEVYSVFSVVNGRLKENVDPFDLHLRGDEFGIDGCGITIGGDLVGNTDDAEAGLSSSKDAQISFTFLQAKRSEGFDYGEMSKFFDGVCDFFSGGMDGESDQLDDLAGAIRAVYSSALRRNPSIYLYFVSTGKYEGVQRIERLIEASRSRLDDMSLFSEIHIELLGAKELQESYRSATSANSQEIEFPDNKTLPLHPDVAQAFIGFVDGEQLLRLATVETQAGPEINQSVFFDNIRDFDPASPINKKIMQDIESGERLGFVFRNNGVTVVARGINRTGDRFLVEDFQIVNGCQTSNILFECRDSLEGVSVPFRLIGSADNDFITSIIIGTNSQNAVKEEQFWALKPFMKDLEEFCGQKAGDEKLYLERRENQYRDASIERTRVLRPSDLMKAVAAMFIFQPHRAARDARGIRREYSDKFFVEAHSVLPYHSAGYASYRFDYLIRNRKLERSNNIYKFYVLFRLGLKTVGRGRVFDLRSNKVEKIAAEINRMCGDEQNFIKFCNDTRQEVEGLLQKLQDMDASSVSRERLRDALRSETFAHEFDKLHRKASPAPT